MHSHMRQTPCLFSPSYQMTGYISIHSSKQVMCKGKAGERVGLVLLNDNGCLGMVALLR